MEAHNQRSEKGVGLLAMVSVAVIAAFWMAATAALVVPAIQRTSAERGRDVLRNAAETSLDWGVDTFNNSSTRSTIDTTAGTVKVSNVPSSILPSGYTGTISVSAALPPTYTYLYNTFY